MVVIRLSRVGKKNSPSYRVVVADKQRAVKRKFIEIIGHYNPTMKPKELVIDRERAIFWMGQGAQASDTVNNLMADLGIIDKSKKIKKVYGKATKKNPAPEEAKTEVVAEAETEEKAEEVEETSPVAEEVEAAADVAETPEETETPEAEKE